MRERTSMENTYDARLKRIYDALHHTEPDVVPILSTIETFAIGYSDTTVEYIQEDWTHEVDVYVKPFERLYTDALYTAGLALDSKYAEIIGSPGHFVSRDGQTVQHYSDMIMEPEDYDALIADPLPYLMNELLPRRAKRLAGSAEEKRAALNEFMQFFAAKSKAKQGIIQRLKEEFDIPVLAAGGSARPSMDVFFDYLRSFKGISIDMRKRPEKLLKAIEAIEPWAHLSLALEPGQQVPEYPPYATMMHAPTFLSPEQFSTFYLPSYERVINKVFAAGGTLILFLEGTWKNKYDWINSLPKDKVFCVIEDDDIFEAKKLIGENVCLIGGMSLGLLKYGTADECIEYAKKVIDECAPGGGFIFGIGQALLSKGDVNFDNLVATHEFVHEYAKK